jgi:hypothetical protein
MTQFVVAPVGNYRPTHFHDLPPGDVMDFHYDLGLVLKTIKSAHTFNTSYGRDEALRAAKPLPAFPANDERCTHTSPSSEVYRPSTHRPSFSAYVNAQQRGMDGVPTPHHPSSSLT